MLKKYCRLSSKFKKIKGFYGEDLAAEAILNKFPVQFLSRGFYVSSGGEIDLIFQSQTRFLFVEVKLDFHQKEGGFLWSNQQRYRLIKSANTLKSKLCKPIELGFCHVQKDSIRFLNQRDW